MLVVDGDRKPLGWVEPQPSSAARSTATMLHRGGTVARVHGLAARRARRRAVLAVSGRGVLVDDDGRLVGTIRADQVLTVIEHTERPGDDAADDRYQRQAAW